MLTVYWVKYYVGLYLSCEEMNKSLGSSSRSSYNSATLQCYNVECISLLFQLWRITNETWFCWTHMMRSNQKGLKIRIVTKMHKTSLTFLSRTLVNILHFFTHCFKRNVDDYRTLETGGRKVCKIPFMLKMHIDTSRFLYCTFTSSTHCAIHQRYPLIVINILLISNNYSANWNYCTPYYVRDLLSYL